jgi:hypothetical protein
MGPPPNYIGITMANWERRAVFDSKAQCESVATPRVGRPFGRGKMPWTITSPGPDHDLYRNFPQCVSSHYPRLERN